MQIYFMEGFDAQTSTNHNWLPGGADIANFSYIPPLSTNTYTDGYLKGQALFWNIKAVYGGLGGNGYTPCKLPSNARVLRQCVWMKRSSTNVGSNDTTGFLYFNFGGTDSAVGIYMRASDATLWYGYGPVHGSSYIPGLTPPTILGSASSLGFSTDWAFYELWIDADAKSMKFYINGALQGTFSVPSAHLTGSPAVGIVGANQSGSYSSVVDHWIVTDGDRPAPNKALHAVAVTAAFDKYSSSGGLKGKLVMNGVAHDTIPDYSKTSSNQSSWQPDHNTATVTQFLYAKNPETGLDWNSLSEIDSWGVCAVNLGSDTTSTAYERLCALALSFVETTSDTNGFPVISYHLPSALTYFSGNWVKVDDTKTFAGNVSTMPRPGGDIDDINFLTTNVDGCILFPADVTNDTGILKDLGLTFAEEYKTNYQDWDSILGDGIKFDSYFITGYSVLGEGNKSFQSNYVSVNYEELSVGQAYLQGLWDYALDGDTGRWSSKQPIYRFPGNYKHQTRKLKVRGNGLALQIKISSEDNKDFKINGWSIFATGDTAV